MKNLCIIPARGGSKRIPRKNIKLFMGKPIIGYSIEAALRSGLFDEVMVSTDDEDIAEVARKYGAKVPFSRSAETSNDHAALADVLHEVLDTYQESGKRFDNMCCILATAPLISSSDIISAYNKLIESDFTSIVPVVQFSYPIWRSYCMDENGIITFNWPEYSKSRSQDLSPAYHDSGTFYWHKITPWLEGTVRKGGITVDEMNVQDIDTETDWKLAELKFSILHDK